MTPTQLILLAAILLAVVALTAAFVRSLYRELGNPCPTCGAKLLRFEELAYRDQAEVEDILSMYGNVKDGLAVVLACTRCNRLYDAGCWEKRSWFPECGAAAAVLGCALPDMPSAAIRERGCKLCGGSLLFPASLKIRERPDMNKYLESGIECFQCPRGAKYVEDCAVCDTPVKLYVCSRCMTPHLWIHPDGKRFEYLMPLVPHKQLARQGSRVGV